jgi:asparagine synthase (glutamine-hydrolysing)
MNIFGIIKKKVPQSENTKLIDTLKSKSAYFRIVEGNKDFITGSVPDSAEYQSGIIGERGDLVAIADANITNREQLFQRLNISPNQQEGFNDTDLILRCYQKWNKEIPDYIEGEFALAVWNKESGELYLATDHLGHRQLYYYDSPEYFIFSSQLKELTTLINIPRIFNDAYLIDYFYKLQNPETTFLKNIHLLPSGHLLTYNHKDSYKTEKYWTLNGAKKYHFSKDEDWFECARDLIVQATHKRVIGGKKIGITLSGGLDSSSIACILAGILKEKKLPLYAFSSVLPLKNEGKDERKYIETLLRHHPNIIPEYIEMPEHGTFTDLENSFYIDEAIPDSFQYVDHSILKSAKQKGIQNLFTGYGGDFWISWKGNSVIYQLLANGSYQEGIRLLKASGRYHQHSLMRSFRINILPHIPLFKVLKNKLGKSILPGFFKEQFLKDYDYASLKANEAYRQSTISEVYSGKFGKRLATIRIRNSYYGMESSVPLLDKSLVEFFLDVPETLFVKNGVPRSLIRESMKDILPDSIRLRKDKLPYAPGFNERLVNDKDTMLQLINEPDSGFIFDKYIDKSALVKRVESLSRANAPGTFNTLSIIQTINTMVALKSLKKQNVYFE